MRNTIYQNTISLIDISLFNNAVNLKYKAKGIEAWRVSKSANIFGSYPCLFAYGSQIMAIAAAIIRQVPIISCFVTGWQQIVVTMMVRGPWRDARVNAWD